MDRYLKYVICRYPCIGGQIYMSSQGLAIQIMSKDGYLIFLDCRARQLFCIFGGVRGPRFTVQYGILHMPNIGLGMA